MSRIYRLFLSHSWSSPGDRDRLKRLLDSQPLFDFIDYSVSEGGPVQHPSNDSALFHAIYRELRLCDVMLVMAGMYSVYSRWMDKELEIAKQGFPTPRPIVVLKPHANAYVAPPVALNADAIVEWNAVEVVDVIKRLAGRL